MYAILRQLKRSYLLVALLLMGCLPVLAQTRTIQGKVTDAQNGENGGTITDIDGNFKLAVPSSVKKVTISYIGYINKVVDISSTMDVKLEPDSRTLSDVVVIGYGTARKSDLTGSVATVTTKDFNVRES